MTLLTTDRSVLQDLSYSKLITFDSFGDRLNYLSLINRGYKSPRDISDRFYRGNKLWREVRDHVIARDMGYDLGIPGVNIDGRVLVHHMIPITEEDILEWNEDILLNPDNLITTSYDTHAIIHYKKVYPESNFIERTPGDTKLW